MKTHLFLWQRLSGLLIMLGLSIVLAACGGNDDDDDVTLPVEPTKNLSLQLAGGGSVQSNPARLSCTTDCSALFDEGTTVTLIATPAADFSFTGWSGACSGTGACVVFLDRDLTVTANFVPNPTARNYTLTVALAGGGSVVSQPAGINCGSACSAAYLEGTVVSLSATPSANQSFAGWSGACSGASSCVVTLNQLGNVTATFTPITAANFTLTTSVSGNGSISSNPAGIACGSTCSAQYAAGTNVTLTATPAAGQVFSGWSGACSGTAPTCLLSLTQARSAQAVFVVAALPAPAWQTAALLESSNDFNIAPAGGNMFAVTAVAPNGNAMAIWEQSDGSPDGSTVKVFSRWYVAGIGWQSPVLLPNLSGRFGVTNGSQFFGNNSLFIDANGTATYLRINQLSVTNYILEARRYTAAGGWTAPITTQAYSFDFDAKMDAAGAIRVVFRGSQIFSKALSVSGTWSAQEVVGGDNNLITVRRPHVALSANGTALAVWAQTNPGDTLNSLWASRLTSSGWSTPQAIETGLTDVSNIALPKVAMDAQGNGIAMWLQGSALYRNSFSTSSGWGTEVLVQSNLPVNTNIQLAMTPAGRAVATWTGPVGVNESAPLRSVQYDPSAGWTTPVSADGYNINRVMQIDNDGNAVVVYRPFPTNTSALFDIGSRRLAFGGTWSALTLLEIGAGEVNDLRFSMNAAGQGVSVWSQDDVANTEVRNSFWGAVLR